MVKKNTEYRECTSCNFCLVGVCTLCDHEPELSKLESGEIIEDYNGCKPIYKLTNNPK